MKQPKKKNRIDAKICINGVSIGKPTNNDAMKSLILSMIIMLSTKLLPGQILSIWIGQTPGSERAWQQPNNWSTQTIPNEFSDVVIRTDETLTNNYPIYPSGLTEINSLHICPGAQLYIRSGDIVVLDNAKSYYHAAQIKRSLWSDRDRDSIPSADNIASISGQQYY
ncbi:MAG: hypothetical protein M3R25_10610 [Bacteroidota bacterium]|nr:hypothetical protein [Bacteroidota bacterium]